MRIDPMSLAIFLSELTWYIDLPTYDKKSPPAEANGLQSSGETCHEREKAVMKSRELDEGTYA